MPSIEIGIAHDLASERSGNEPDDYFEEYDSPETIDALAETLRSLGHRVRPLGGGHGLLRALLDAPPELVFNVAEGGKTRSREAHVPAVCEMLGIPITHSDPTTLCLCLDKALAKQVVRAAGVPTPAGIVVTEASARPPFDFPMIAKPVGEGSSIGLRSASRIDDAQQLRDRIGRLLADYQQPVLVEPFCSGPEFTVGIVGNGAAATVLGVMEVVPRTCALDEFVYSVDVKRRAFENVDYVVPPDRSKAIVDRIAEIAMTAYRALSCRDIARIDVRMDPRGEPQFLEANPIPGLKPGWGDIVVLAERVGIAYADLLARVVDGAWRRYTGGAS